MGFDHRHLFWRGDDDHTRSCSVAEDLLHPLGLLTDDPHLHEARENRWSIDLRDDVTSGLCIDHHNVVVLLTHLPTQLADGEDFLHAWSRIGHEVEDSRERADGGDQWIGNEQTDVFAQRLFRCHPHCVQIGFDFPRFEGEVGGAEDSGDCALVVHLDEQRALAGAHRLTRECHCYRCLTYSALARDEEEAPLQQTSGRHGRLRRVRQLPKPSLRVPSGAPNST